MKYRIAVAGATGNVGRELLSSLAERKFPVQEIIPLASENSKGREVSFGEHQTLTVRNLQEFSWKNVDLALFATDAKISKTFVPRAVKAGAVVIDNSSHFRLEPGIPLVVPEVNGSEIAFYKKKRIIANPNCVIAPLAMVLKPLMAAATIKRVVISTYQSVSGAGQAAMDELYHQSKSVFVNDPVDSQVFPKQIAFNVIPHIDHFLHDGATGEESKIMMEAKKILDPSVRVASTCVRVPVFIGHAMSVNIEFKNDLLPADAKELLKKMPGLSVIDNPKNNRYITPLEAVGHDDVVVSRIRRDPTIDHGLSLWVASDNLRKGAALNVVQIAESLINDYGYTPN